MSRCLIIINPVSGGGRARRYVMELQWQLSALFDRLEVMKDPTIRRRPPLRHRSLQRRVRCYLLYGR